MKRVQGLWKMIVVAVVAMSVGGADAAATGSGSGYCAAIDVEREATKTLAERFDAFAEKAGLAIDASHPLMRIYYPTGSNVIYPTDSTVMVILQNGMGRFGSILSFHPLRGEPPPDLLERLQRFVDGEIAKSYRITPCEEIEGFTPPVIYH